MSQPYGGACLLVAQQLLGRQSNASVAALEVLSLQVPRGVKHNYRYAPHLQSSPIISVIGVVSRSQQQTAWTVASSKLFLTKHWVPLRHWFLSLRQASGSCSCDSPQLDLTSLEAEKTNQLLPLPYGWLSHKEHGHTIGKRRGSHTEKSQASASCPYSSSFV